MFKTQVNRLLLAVVILNACAVVGCHRGYYRRQADAEAKRLILQKSVDPRWNTASGTIDIDPQSRMFDPFSADHPPIPPDDAASHQLMHCVDGKPGYPQWNANGDTNYVESPDWRAYLPMNDSGQVVLTLDGAYQLALAHSPELQDARETLYLSALDVSLDRFGFDSQLFAGYNSFFTTQGRLRNASGQSSSTLSSQLGANGGGINLNRLGITGTNFAVGLANTVLFNFAGNNTQSATSLIDFSIIQPLLRGAGRERIMESLTQAERTLLANVRQLERFRRGFYLQVAIGRNLSDRLNRGGNFLGTPASASTNAGGYFGLLQQQQNIRNQELNVRQLEAVLALFNEFFLRERLDAVQLKSFETQVYTEQRDLLEQRINYQTALDQFKQTIGLPPDLDVVIDDTYLERFELISDQVNEQLIRTGALREETGSVLNAIDELFVDLESVDDIATGKFAWPDNLAERIDKLVPYLDKAESTIEQVLTRDRAQLEADFEKLDEKRTARLEYLNKLKTGIESGAIESPIDPNLFDVKSLPDSAELRSLLFETDSPESIVNRANAAKLELAAIKTKINQFRQIENDLAKPEVFDFVLREFQEKIPGQFSEVNNIVLEISLLQARTRSNSIEIIDIDIDSTDAIDIARCMRRDWMNARASLVDNWRNIEFVADQLEAQVDLVFEGDMGNNGDNPFKLRYETGQLRAGFRFDAPIVRLAERNQYRAALISYQQTRRDFYQFEDSVKRNLREITRNIDRNKVLFELDRRRVQVQIDNVEINRYELEKPVGPGQTGGGRLGATTAQNLASAIIGLNSAQDSFLRTWVQYEVLRRNLDFDMGTMQLDQNFQWIDPGKIDAAIGQRAATEMGIELDCQFCGGVAAPGYVATDLISSTVPSVIETQPQSLPFENERSTPLDTEQFDNQRFDNRSAPQLNRPESGMRQRRSVLPVQSSSADPSSNNVPSLLFRSVDSGARSNSPFPATLPVNLNLFPSGQPTDRVASQSSDNQFVVQPNSTNGVRTAQRLDENRNQPTLQTRNSVSPISRSVPNLNSDSQPIYSPSPAKSVLSDVSHLSPIFRESDSGVSSLPNDANSFVAERIAEEYSQSRIKQVSGIVPASEVLQSLEILAKPEPKTRVQIPQSNEHQIQVLKAHTTGFRPMPALSAGDLIPNASMVSQESSPSQEFSPDSQPINAQSPMVESDWQLRPSSLGGVLNRFRTATEK